jgi:hypothetical protein
LAVQAQSVRLGPKARAFPSPLGHRANGFAYPRSLPAWRARAPGPTSPRPPIAHNGRLRDWNPNQLSIACALPPRLRPASPAADQHGCGTLGHSVGRIRTALALLMPTFALPAAPPPLPGRLLGKTGTLPYQSAPRRFRGIGHGLSPGGLSVPRHGRPVSYYALFQGWLLLSQPPGCLRAVTALPTEPVVGDLSRRSGLFPSRRRIFAPAVSRPAPPRRHSAFGSGR